ncbi:MAG: DUF2249 domain-containing protein [Ignavibacteriae bacterium]|nr:DUF2249 domain-containing protein [Ignavibacteriota bacterium]
MHIMPETNIAALLEVYPQLEEALLAHSPAFATPRNAVLRSAIAKVTTIAQLAALDKTTPGALVNLLRERVGQNETRDAAAQDGAHDGTPSWVVSATVLVRYDAREDLAAGVHPAQRVMRELSELPAGGVYQLVTPFRPGPLIDMAHGRGYESWTRKDAEGAVITFFSVAGA